MAYISTEGYAINFELHEGKQHCQKGTVEFLQETIKLAKQLTDKPLLIRLDSGNDSIDNVAVLVDEGCLSRPCSSNQIIVFWWFPLTIL